MMTDNTDTTWKLEQVQREIERYRVVLHTAQWKVLLLLG
jgi:hypothetical protein